MSRPTEHEQRPPDYRHYLQAYERAWQQYRQDPSAHNRELLSTGEQILYRELTKPGRFELGAVVATPGAIDAVQLAHLAKTSEQGMGKIGGR